MWFFKVPQAGQDLYSGEPVFFDLERGGNGTYTANLPAGEYHAEAFAYDHETDTPYRPMLAGGFESPTIFTVEGNTTSITGVNFSLEAEYRMSQEFAEVQGTVTTAGGGKVEHVFFDLFPVLDGVRQTDYPVHSFGIDREGKIKGMAPVGTFEVEAFSPDNSYYLDAPLDMNISAGQMNDLGTIQMLEKQLVTNEFLQSVYTSTKEIYTRHMYYIYDRYLIYKKLNRRKRTRRQGTPRQRRG